LFRGLESYLRLHCIPIELNCPDVRVKTFEEKGNTTNKEGKKKYTGKRISRKRYRRGRQSIKELLLYCVPYCLLPNNINPE
jgi:hypothetical protein